MSLDGTPILFTRIPKVFRDIIEFHHSDSTAAEFRPVQDDQSLFPPSEATHAQVKVLRFDPNAPLNKNGEFSAVKPGEYSPICQKCGLFTTGCKNPFLAPVGSENPDVTVIVESVAFSEDEKGSIGSGSRGVTGYLQNLFADMALKSKVTFDKVRWVPLIRCVNRAPKKKDKPRPTSKAKANWCGLYALMDLKLHPPKLIIPVGTTVLGFLSYKSNAQDWGGHLMTYRGWPDSWLMDPRFTRDRESLTVEDGKIIGHPLFGKMPSLNDRIPMIPIQAPGIVLATANKVVVNRWHRMLLGALSMVAAGDIPTRDYDRPWYKISTDPSEIERTLSWLIDHPRTLISYDTETTGLRAYSKDAAIVYMMFRWVQEGQPHSIGFPWKYPESPLFKYIGRLSPTVLKAITESNCIGHNYSFDALFTAATVKGARLDELADCCVADTWHEAFVLKQTRGTLSLDMMAYQHVPDLGGYDEDFSILISRFPELLDPEVGGHYANCPPEYVETHLKPYVMGDAEVTYLAHESIQEKLEGSARYKIPIAHLNERGKFRMYEPMSRKDVYKKIVVPASRLLTKMMGRGMQVDLDELAHQEELLPKLIFEKRAALRKVSPEVLDWCESEEQKDPKWFLDLENKKHLRHVLFKTLKLPIKHLTEAGRKQFDDVETARRSMSEEARHAIDSGHPLTPDQEKEFDRFLSLAAIDKFTLNIMAAENPAIRPLQEYRSLAKQYGSYIRPIRNIFTAGVDKKKRVQEQHLAADGRIHTRFMITGTRSGRLSSCIPVDELVSTSRGIVPIGDVIVGDLIQTPEGPSRIDYVFPREVKEVVELTLRNGMAVRSSLEHRHLRLDGQLVEAARLCVGDCLVPCNVQGPGPIDYVAIEPWDIRYERGSSILTIPLAIDEDVAFIFGHISAEGGIYGAPVRESSRPSGHARSRNEPTGKWVANRVQTSFGWDEKDLQFYVADLFKSKFSKMPSVRKGTTALIVDLSSRDLAEWMLFHGLGGLARDKRVPPAIFRSPQSVQWSYLRALFEGDGSGSRVSLTTYSRNLAKDVLVLLSSLGVLARISRRMGVRENGTKRQRFEVAICPESYDFVREKRLFWSDRKLKQVPAASLRYSSDCIQKRRQATRNQNYSIKSIKRLGRKEVVDISVENLSHTFAYQVVTHNCEPNFQQLPSRGMVKRIYTSRFKDRGLLFQGDLSQIELRLIAAACGDQAMVDAYNNGIDLHSLTMSRVFNRPYEECLKDFVVWLQKHDKHKEAKECEIQRKISKCVDPSTLVSVDGRIVRVGDLHPGREPDTFYPMSGSIQGPSGPVPLRNFYSNGVKKRILVCSRRGIIACSEEHPLLMRDGTLKKAKDIRVGDPMAELFDMPCGKDVHTLDLDLRIDLKTKETFPTWIFNADNSLKARIIESLFSAGDRLITNSWTFAQDVCVLLSSSQRQFNLETDSNCYRISLKCDQKPNVCTTIIELPPGQVVDVEVATEDHLFVANNLGQRNTANFLTGYGGGAQGLQGTLAEDGIYKTIEECEQFLEAFFDSYPTLRDYLGYYKRFILNSAVAVSILGRVRIFDEVYSADKKLQNKALRAGCNHLIQATASDMMLICNCAIEALMRDQGMESQLINTVHDSLLIDSVENELPEINEIAMSVFTSMPDVLEAWLGRDVDTSWSRMVPFDGDCELGENYLDMIKIPHGKPDWDEILSRVRSTN